MEYAGMLLRFCIFGGVLPYLLGGVFTKRIENNPCFPMNRVLNGYILMWAVVQLISVPMIYLGRSFGEMTAFCCNIFLVIALWQLVCERKTLWTEWKGYGTRFRERGFWYGVLILLMILQAIYVGICYQVNDDDAFYVASAQTSLDTNTLFSIDPYTGEAFSTFPARYVLSPFPLFMAFISKLVGVKATVMAHTLLPMVLIMLVYAVYSLWAGELFRDNHKAQTMFMFFVMVVLAFSDFSTHARGMMMFPRIWQGKAVLATILLPLVLLWGVRMIQYPLKKTQWIYMFVVMLACCHTSSMGIMLAAIELGLCGLLAALTQKNIRLLFYTILCCIPNLIYAGIYVLIR